MKSGEAQASSVLGESENKAEKPMLFQSWCHLTMNFFSLLKFLLATRVSNKCLTLSLR